jgi:hypothetical protein
LTTVNCTVECIFQEDGLCALDEIQVVQDGDRADCASYISPERVEDDEQKMDTRRPAEPGSCVDVHPFWV